MLSSYTGDLIDLLSELGVAVLLFLVGIKLDVKLIRSLGQVALLTGLGQVLFTSIFGYLIGLALGLGHVASIYVAVALTFSSTIIIVKLLSDKREIDSLHGQIALGFLVLGVFERKGTPRELPESELDRGDDYEVIIFGLGRFGTAIGLRLSKLGLQVLGIDFNPFAVRRWRELGLKAEFGDATDPEFVSGLPLVRAEWIVSTVPIHATGLSHEDARTTLIQLSRTSGFRGRIAVTSHSSRDIDDMLGSGADIVLEPFQDAADRAVDLVCGGPRVERTDIPSIETEERQES